MIYNQFKIFRDSKKIFVYLKKVVVISYFFIGRKLRRKPLNRSRKKFGRSIMQYRGESVPTSAAFYQRCMYLFGKSRAALLKRAVKLRTIRQYGIIKNIVPVKSDINNSVTQITKHREPLR